MISGFSRFGTTTSLDLVKHGNGQHGSKRRHDLATDSYYPHLSNSTHNEQNLHIHAGFKRPRLSPEVTQDTIEASEICRTANESISHPQISEYSQRQATRSTPSASLNPLLRLSHPSYGLPESLVQNFITVGIDSIYPWQSSCLLGRGILTGERNLVYSAPTGGGKSLVADVLMLKRVIEDSTKKAILVLPYVALVQEKLSWLRKIVAGVSKKDQNAVGASVCHEAASKQSNNKPSSAKAMLIQRSGTAFSFSLHPSSQKCTEHVLKLNTSGRIFWWYQSFSRCEMV